MKKYRTFITILIFYFLFSMVAMPKLFLQTTLNGISAWAGNVLPSLLPFVFFTKLLSSYGDITFITKPFAKPMKKLFRSPSESCYVFFMSMVSGYPVGAKITADLYQSGKISRADAFKMMSFCSTSGPMFIVGAVGVGMLGNATFGYIIFISHILGAIFNGLLYRKIKVQDLPINIKNSSNKPADLSQIVIDTCLSVLSVGAIIALFFVIIQSFNPLLSLMPKELSSILSGLVEITKGCIDISSSFSGILPVIACTFVITFGGLSTIMQSLAMLDKIKMPASLFTLQKLSHALLATIISVILCCIFF